HVTQAAKRVGARQGHGDLGVNIVQSVGDLQGLVGGSERSLEIAVSQLRKRQQEHVACPTSFVAGRCVCPECGHCVHSRLGVEPLSHCEIAQDPVCLTVQWSGEQTTS